MLPWRTRRIALKDASLLAMWSVTAGGSYLPAFAPLGSVLDDPVRQGAFEPDVVAGLLRFNPLMLENLLSFRLKLLVERGILKQVIPVRRLWNVRRHSR